ncbi:MAG: polysaccharide deacetylase [Symbiobacteriaceae bacterium]|nr:polysaccharide deacetylase [Symbiobacteriaceae bacterium]
MLHVKLPPTFPAERQYICGVVLGEFLGLDYRIEVMERGDVAIGQDDGRELRLADVFFQTPGDQWLKAGSLPVRPLERWALPGTVFQPTVPVLYGRQYYEVAAGQITLGLDIFGSLFFLLTRYEDVVLRAAGESAASLAVQEGYADRPLADEYVEILWRALQTLWPGLTRRERVGRVLLTHDVINPTSGGYTGTVVHTAGDLVKRGSPLLAVRRLAGSVRALSGHPEADVANTFDLIMDLAETYGLKSEFYLRTDSADASPVGLPWMRGLLRRIAERGHAVGLAASSAAGQDPERLRQEVGLLAAVVERAGLRQGAWGGRQQGLRWDPSASWAAWASAGLDFDSSIGWTDRNGFRSGTCREYPVFDLARRRPLALRERPLIATDAAVLESKRVPPEEAAKELPRLRERCRLVGGDFVLQWRNDRLASRREREIFVQVLRGL